MVSAIQAARYAPAMSSRYLILLGVAVLVGGVIPIQAVVNSRLGSLLGTDFSQKVTATTISFLGGTAGVLLLLAVSARGIPRIQTPLADIPPLFFTGGLYGVVFVTSSIILVPRLGAAATIGGMLCGQMIISTLFDHFGWLGTPQVSVTPMRMAGLAAMLAGIVLLSNKPATPTAPTPEVAADAPLADRLATAAPDRPPR